MPRWINTVQVTVLELDGLQTTTTERDRERERIKKKLEVRANEFASGNVWRKNVKVIGLFWMIVLKWTVNCFRKGNR